MSDYYKSLNNEDKIQYMKKLTLENGQNVLPDPFSIVKWDNDILLLPDVSYVDLLDYLINTPSEFTKENMKTYKSLEAYNFFLNGHVQEVYHYGIKDTEYCFIKSTVLPSQRQGKNQTPYEVWICLHTTGWILSGNCTCMVGYVH